MPRKKKPTNDEANPKTKVVRPLKDRIEEQERKLAELKRRQAMASLKDTEEGRRISILYKAADVLEGLDENPMADDIRETCRKIAEEVGVELP